MTLRNSQLRSGSDSSGTVPMEFEPSWASDAPLRLVASVLNSMPERTGKAGDIQRTLEAAGVALNPKWQTWWQKRVRPALAKSGCFQIGKDNSVTLLVRSGDVPAEPLGAARGKGTVPKKSRTPKEKTPSKLEMQWLAWFQGKAEGPPPTRGRTKEAQNALEKCAAEDVKKSLYRTNLAVAELLEGRTVPKQAAEGWAKLLSRAASRLRGRNEMEGGDDLPKSVGEHLVLLVHEAGYPYESGQWLRQAGGMIDEQPAEWHRTFLAGIWRAFDKRIDSPRDWFKSAFYRSAFEDQATILQAMALAGLVESASTYRAQADR